GGREQWFHSATRMNPCGAGFATDKKAEPKVLDEPALRTMRYEPCKHCGKEIQLFFRPDGSELWLHVTGHRSCIVTKTGLVYYAEPHDKPAPAPLGLPQPSADGATAEDDLIGQ